MNVIAEIAIKYPALARGIEIAVYTFIGLSPSYIQSVVAGNIIWGISSLATNIVIPAFAAWQKYVRDNQKALLDESARAAYDVLSNEE